MNALSIILDVLVLIGLGITIFYCVKLSKSLNTFRSARQDFGNVMRDLSNSIDEAYRAVDNLKVISRDSGQNLQKIINESRTIARELEVMNKSLSELASGLESGLESRIESRFEEEGADFDDEEQGFRIFDRESEREDEELAASASAAPHKQPARPGEFSSQAERDLYEALQSQSRSTPGRRGSA